MYVPNIVLHSNCAEETAVDHLHTERTPWWSYLKSSGRSNMTSFILSFV